MSLYVNFVVFIWGFLTSGSLGHTVMMEPSLSGFNDMTPLYLLVILSDAIHGVATIRWLLLRYGTLMWSFIVYKLMRLQWKTFNFFEVSEITLSEEDGSALFDVCGPT